MYMQTTMEYVGVEYTFTDQDGRAMTLKISNDNGKYFLTAVHQGTCGSKTWVVEVFPTATNFVECGEITNEDKNFLIANKRVLAFKMKCKFRGRVLSTKVSSILVQHEGFKNWVTYPIDLLGEVTET